MFLKCTLVDTICSRYCVCLSVVSLSLCVCHPFLFPVESKLLHYKYFIILIVVANYCYLLFMAHETIQTVLEVLEMCALNCILRNVYG